MHRVNLAIIGAGPAGMAAAAEAAKAGVRVLLLDEQATLGGQIFRNVEVGSELRGAVLGRDYRRGALLTDAVAKSDVDYVAKARVWSIEENHVAYSTPDGEYLVEADHVLLATGALERAMPVPGWTLPGVMTAGAAQIMLKQSGIVAREAVLVGSGPLLYLVAVQLVRAGFPPKALVETQTRSDMRRAMTHWRAAMRGWRYLQKGAATLNELRNAGVPRYVKSRNIALLGSRRVDAVHFSCGGAIHEMATDTVLLHHGVVPDVQAARMAGIEHHWNAQQNAFVPKVDPWGRTECDGVWIAGDGAGIGGAMSAELSGRITGLAVAHELGSLPRAERDRRANPLIGQRNVELSIRPFIDRAFPPYHEALAPEDEVTVCRCEEVKAGQIREAAEQGCLGPNQAKAFTRAGMGRCQGRYCGLSVSRILADANNRSMDDTGYVRVRPPLKPVTLGQVAALHDPNAPLEQAGGHD
ncbi:NAD(P)/FAD-dependent oxidoreductase [Shimia abyssi]|uniref:Thioredoxin reductase n=1 Tax=Shimia abyssi TaxID=1662395 RepID=A0A2P8FHM3_9RHOB|nr:NAD(P)/FAD-dependent oxidoreductase [Shimia abyssi]PSL21232.1 thioredoxin reductase [Shimia abyssi]